MRGPPTYPISATTRRVSSLLRISTQRPLPPRLGNREHTIRLAAENIGRELLFHGNRSSPVHLRYLPTNLCSLPRLDLLFVPSLSPFYFKSWWPSTSVEPAAPRT